MYIIYLYSYAFFKVGMNLLTFNILYCANVLYYTYIVYTYLATSHTYYTYSYNNSEYNIKLISQITFFFQTNVDMWNKDYPKPIIIY